MKEHLYTGYLTYKEIEFAFAFDGEELRLTPPSGKEREIFHEWILTPMEDGSYVYTSKTPKMEVDQLVAKCSENGNELVFLSRKGAQIGFRNAIFIIPIYGYIVCKSERNMIARLSFVGPEIDCIHPVNQAVEYMFDHQEYVDKGIFSVTTLGHEKTTTKEQTFMVDDRKVSVQFSITRGMSTTIGNPPISLFSSMLLEFEETDDYEFITKLWSIAKQFIRFLCYRKNVYFPSVELSASDGKGKYYSFATLHMLHEDGDNETEALKNRRYIQQSFINGYEGKILEDIAENSLYTRHIPETYASGKRIDAARFVMIIAAFEWEFRRIYPEGVPKDEKQKQIELTASEAINGLINKSTGKLRRKYKFLKRLVKSDPLQNEIAQIGKDFDEIVGMFGKHLYGMNNEILVYAEMGRRLGEQRNHFAHGDLDKEFIGTSLLDLIYMEFILYAMQLKRYGISKMNTQKAINQLFERHVMIREEE